MVLGRVKKKVVAAVLAAAMILGMVGCGKTEPTLGTEDSLAGGRETQETHGTEEKKETQEYGTIEISELPDFTGAQAWDSDLYVEPVTGIDNDFIRGVDISSYLSIIESGATFKDFDGNVVDEEGFFHVLAQAGINWVRIRVWNDPYDTKGNGYGGGHNDVETAIRIGRLATAAGMKVLINFHYSDFWADPNKQKAPKAWAHLTYEDKKAAMTEFTETSLQAILDAGVNVGMVQVGNETVSGLAGETEWDRMCELMQLGSAAIRKVAKKNDKDIRIAVHFTNPSSKSFIDYAENLKTYGVDYDIFATSYYSFWHGTTEKLTSQLALIAERYGKDVLVMETSYAYTNDDGDGFANSVSLETENLVLNYEFSEQGQVNAIRDVMQAVSDVGDAGLGMFYWEPAWIPVQVYDPSAPDAAEVLASNREKWETYGSGWASSFAKTYDPNDAGKYYGGASWDNQAMFDFRGYPLDSLNVYKYVFAGTTAPLTVTGVQDAAVEIGIGEEVILPETVNAVLVSGSLKEVPVSWNEEQAKAAQQAGAGLYYIDGTADVDGTAFEVQCQVDILRVNYIKNPGFEGPDMSMWNIDGTAVDREDDNNKRTGTYSLKFWSQDAFSYTVEQEITDLAAGTYELGAFLQGGDAGSSAVFRLYVTVGDKTYTADSAVNGWLKWDDPHISDITVKEGDKVTVGVHVESGPGGWGAWDDFYLYKMD